MCLVKHPRVLINKILWCAKSDQANGCQTFSGGPVSTEPQLSCPGLPPRPSSLVRKILLHKKGIFYTATIIITVDHAVLTYIL